MEGKAIATSGISEGTVNRMQKHTISCWLLADCLTLVLGMNFVHARKHSATELYPQLLF